ncbi:MAG TPA: aminopeptidase N [Candidatus Competibacteraceae bacterium]|nr:aminopeptidase N [Candidatus Competibacteraceae bacterium]
MNMAVFRTDTPKTIYRKDYTPPPYFIDTIALRFELGEEGSLVTATSRLRRNPHGPQELALDGKELQLLELRRDGEVLAQGRDFRLEGEAKAQRLILLDPPERFELSVVTRIHPEANTALEGLYKSSGNFCTQCEAEGFRAITFFLDRPDVMAVYTTTIVADQARYPVLLSNGNPVASGELDGGRHFVTWHDPHPKPCYLFALVAGDLALLEDRYTTRSGREVKLRIYSEPHSIRQCDHAMESLKKAMRWDEERFGLEYDLDIYMIVAVADFNMGAMENKGLNIFNTKFVLASPATATDGDFQAVEAVIAHEYFHNWTGNRVTCRDWFQLSLKEGLTVFRDQEFSADMGSPAVKRINDVRMLRSLQFPEDAGPMAHPVRPESYIEINNFYTVTVYEKGAEVVRMYQTLLGRDGFRKGMDLYLRRHDGQAVTCDDFRAAMADANGVDLTQFERWYSQAGTPVVEVEDYYDAGTRSYTLTLRQSCPPTPGQANKLPFHIPLAVGLLDRHGHDLPLRLQGEAEPRGTTRVLELREAEQRFTFVGLSEAPLPSLARGFSAPIKLRYDYSDEQLSFLLAHDSDDFNRWEAGQTLLTRTLLKLVEERRQGHTLRLPATLLEACALALERVRDPALLAEILTPPGESYLAEQMAVVDVEGIHAAREFLIEALARQLGPRLLDTYHAHHDAGPYRLDGVAIGRRALKNRCLEYLMRLGDRDSLALCQTQLRSASNMTDELGALACLVNYDGAERDLALDEFYRRWQGEALVVDKWFALQAGSRLPDTVERVQRLLHHPAFNLRNPNKVRALIGSFCNGNPAQFHRADGAGYVFLAERILELDGLNPQVTARLAGALSRWRRYDEGRQVLMKIQLERILAKPGLSPDVYEVVSKSLAG